MKHLSKFIFTPGRSLWQTIKNFIVLPARIFSPYFQYWEKKIDQWCTELKFWIIALAERQFKLRKVNAVIQVWSSCVTLYFCKKGRSQPFQTVSPGKGAAAMQCYSLPFKEDAAKLLKCYYSPPKLISPLAVQIHVKCYITRQAMPTNSLKSLPRKTCFSSGHLLSKMAAKKSLN